uniref:Uncharacterized protein n=1 Tax=Arundo donax TaxID=35708 RepID=A0A0A8XXD8_ARUDO
MLLLRLRAHHWKDGLVGTPSSSPCCAMNDAQAFSLPLALAQLASLLSASSFHALLLLVPCFLFPE